MDTQSFLENPETVILNCKDCPSVQRLLDVLSSILAEEYIAAAKQNPEVFIKNEVKT